MPRVRPAGEKSGRKRGAHESAPNRAAKTAFSCRNGWRDAMRCDQPTTASPPPRPCDPSRCPATPTAAPVPCRPRARGNLLGHHAQPRQPRLKNTTGQSTLRCPAQREITSAARGSGQPERRRRNSWGYRRVRSARRPEPDRLRRAGARRSRPSGKQRGAWRAPPGRAKRPAPKRRIIFLFAYFQF